MGLIPGQGRSPGGGHENPLQYSCLENPMDRRVWRATVHRISESDWTETSQHTCTHNSQTTEFTHLKYMIQCFLGYSQVCVSITALNLQHFHHLKNPLAVVAAPLQYLLSHNQQLIYFVSLQLCLFQAFHINGITVCGLLCLASFTKLNVSMFHPCCYTYQNSVPYYS